MVEQIVPSEIVLHICDVIAEEKCPTINVTIINIDADVPIV